METGGNGPILRQGILSTQKCTVDLVFHGNWREPPDFTAGHLSTQKCTVDPVFHGDWKERPHFTANHLSAQKGAVDPVVHASVREPKNAPLIQPFMETRGNDKILRQSI